jgi:hypothetical protein
MKKFTHGHPALVTRDLVGNHSLMQKIYPTLARTTTT